jgi:hypothetical protein
MNYFLLLTFPRDFLRLLCFAIRMVGAGSGIHNFISHNLATGVWGIIKSVSIYQSLFSSFPLVLSGSVFFFLARLQPVFLEYALKQVLQILFSLCGTVLGLNVSFLVRISLRMVKTH